MSGKAVSFFDVAAIPAAVRELCECLQARGFGAWVVGGCVRDLLLSRPVHDWDIATSAHPEQVMQVFRKVVPTGVAHGTVTVLHRGRSYEVTTLRGERGYSDGRRPDEVFFVDGIVEDLARRDFTFNAMAYAPSDEQLIDPHGGLVDLRQRTLRAVGDAQQRFDEDGLRVLRAARLAAVLEFDIEAATYAAMAQALPTFRKVSRERVRDEWCKTLLARQPSRGFEIMRQTGILAVVCAELAALADRQSRGSAELDAWQHTLRCVDALSANVELRLAGLFHELGEVAPGASTTATAATMAAASEEQAAKRSVGDRFAADRLNAWMREYRFANGQRQRAVSLVEQQRQSLGGARSDADLRHWLCQVEVASVDDLLSLAAVSAAAWRSPVAEEIAAVAAFRDQCARVLAERPALSLADLAVKGADLLELSPRLAGPLVGKLLRDMHRLVIDDPQSNQRHILLAWGRQRLVELGVDQGAEPGESREGLGE